MMYEYECDVCGLRVVLNKSVEERNVFPDCCNCSKPMARVYSIPHIVPNQVADLPENKYAFGFSERDRLETLKRGDKEYEEQIKRAEYRIKYEGSFAPERELTPLESLVQEYGGIRQTKR